MSLSWSVHGCCPAAVAAIPEGLGCSHCCAGYGCEAYGSPQRHHQEAPAVWNPGVNPKHADKTGTITRSKMVVVAAFAGNRLMVKGTTWHRR